MKEKIAKIISNIINIDEKQIIWKIEIPPEKQMWDFAFPTFFLAKTMKKSPNEIAMQILEQIKNEEIFEKIEIKWAYINFFLSNKIYTELFEKLKNQNFENWENKDKTIIVDYIWANVWKPLHIWHMCTPNIGQTIINIYKKLWYNVISDSHIGDWWIIFWKLISAYKLRWDEEKLKNNAVDYLLELYVKITAETEKDESLEGKVREEFKKLSRWDEESINYWKEFTQYSILAMNKQLERLNVKPDFDIWESFYEWLNLPKLQNYPNLEYSMKDVARELVDKKIASENDDASIGVIFDENTNLPSCVLMKRNWTFGYFASDLAAVKYRMTNWNPYKIVYCVDKRQSLHLKQVFEVSKKAGRIWNSELVHVWSWFVELKTWAMSSRKWNIIKLDKLLNEAIEKAWKIIEEKTNEKANEKLKEIIWIGAIKYEYLRKNRELDLVFDWNEFMKFEWNCAPYIMYTYSRWKRILEKSEEQLDKNLELKFEKEEEIELIKKLIKYKEILEQTIKENYPHILANYVYELTKIFNSFYTNVVVLAEQDKTRRSSRLQLTSQTVWTIQDAFEMLWIKVPEKM